MTSRQLPKLKPTVWDALVVALIIALGVIVALGFYGGRRAADGPLSVVVSANGAELARGTLQEMNGTHSYTNRGYTLTVEIADGRVDVTDSNCPGHDCQHSPAITRAGQSIVCLPAQIVIHLEGTPATDAPDVIVG